MDYTPCQHCGTVCYSAPCDARRVAANNVRAYINRAQAGFDASHGATGQSDTAFADARRRLGRAT